MFREREDREAEKRPAKCAACGHSSVVHRLNGACYGESHCLCGWSRGMNGETYVKATGEYVGDVTPRKRNKGVRCSPKARERYMKIPCYFCGGKPETIDHFVARSRGGANDSSNFVSACVTCNGMKGDKSYDELLAYCVSLETAVNRKTALRSVIRFQRWKEQARRILSWHDKRMKSKQAPVV